MRTAHPDWIRGEQVVQDGPGLGTILAFWWSIWETGLLAPLWLPRGQNESPRQEGSMRSWNKSGSRGPEGAWGPAMSLIGENLLL